MINFSDVTKFGTWKITQTQAMLCTAQCAAYLKKHDETWHACHEEDCGILSDDVYIMNSEYIKNIYIGQGLGNTLWWSMLKHDLNSERWKRVNFKHCACLKISGAINNKNASWW